MKIDIWGKYNLITKSEIVAAVNQVELLLGKIGSCSVLEIYFVSDHKMAEVNKKYRGQDFTTDVLSFPQNQIIPKGILGTIFICEEEAINRNESVVDLIKHGLLHLYGYDHSLNRHLWNKVAEKIYHKMN